jgi:hypothetical protein
MKSDVITHLLGCLLNALVEELIIRVTTVEDMPAAIAIHLVTVFSVVISRAPQVFQVTIQLSTLMFYFSLTSPCPRKCALHSCTVGHIGVPSPAGEHDSLVSLRPLLF